MPIRMHIIVEQEKTDVCHGKIELILKHRMLKSEIIRNIITGPENDRNEKNDLKNREKSILGSFFILKKVWKLEKI